MGEAKKEKRIKDVMCHIDEYNKVDSETRLCVAIAVLRENYEMIKANVPGTYHKTMFVTDTSKKIIGKLSIFDLIRGLVPEPAKKPEISRALYSVMSSRALSVADEIGKFQESFQWLNTSFSELVHQECQKRVKEIMSPVHPLLKEEDTINKAIYIMFRENIRQPVVIRDEKIVGVVNIMDVFPVLLEISGDESFGE